MPVSVLILSAHFLFLESDIALEMEANSKPTSLSIIKDYPLDARAMVLEIRQLIMDEAESNENVSTLTEGVRWGEPSFLTKSGSTIRLNWKERAPHTVRVLFNCNTSLVENFRKLYPDVFTFEGNRAIVFRSYDEIPIQALAHCVSLALQYHRLKALPLLGA